MTNKLASSVFIVSAILITGMFATMGLTGQTALAKDSSCDVSAGGKCVITAKRGDIEIDKLTIVVGKGGSDFNATGLEDKISALENQVSDLQAQVANISSTGVTELEINPESTPEVPPVDNGTNTDNGTSNNGTN